MKQSIIQSVLLATLVVSFSASSLPAQSTIAPAEVRRQLPDGFPSRQSDSTEAKMIDALFSKVQKWTFTAKDSTEQDKILDAGERYITWVQARLEPKSSEQSDRLYHYAARLAAKYGLNYSTMPERLKQSRLLMHVFQIQVNVLVERTEIKESNVPTKTAADALLFFAGNAKMVETYENFSNVNFRDIASKGEVEARRLLSLEGNKATISPADLALLSTLYLHGIGVHPDARKHIAYLRQSADGGYADAQLDIGSRLLRGDGVEKNLASAVNYLQRAGKAGLPSAWLLLGAQYQGGNDESAKRNTYLYYRKAADMGNPQGQRMAGIRLCEGEGVEADVTEGIKLVHKAAIAGEQMAMLFLAGCYRGESPLIQSESEATKWSKAFETGKLPVNTALRWKR